MRYFCRDKCHECGHQCHGTTTSCIGLKHRIEGFFFLFFFPFPFPSLPLQKPCANFAVQHGQMDVNDHGMAQSGGACCISCTPFVIIVSFQCAFCARPFCALSLFQAQLASRRALGLAHSSSPFARRWARPNGRCTARHDTRHAPTHLIVLKGQKARQEGKSKPGSGYRLQAGTPFVRQVSGRNRFQAQGRKRKNHKSREGK